MKCPYCLSDIDSEAYVCKVCTKDLYLFKPLIQKVSDLEEKLSNVSDREILESRISEMEEELLYKKELEVFFVNRLRDEIKFENLEELSLNLQLDKKNALDKIKSL